jgi:hypothetical protein
MEWEEGKDCWRTVVNTVISSRGNPVRKNHWENLGVDEKIILKWI